MVKTRFTVFLLLLCLFLGAATANAAAATATATDDKDELIANIWDARTDGLAEIIHSTTLLMKKADTLSGPLETHLKNAGTRFMRLSGLFQAAAGHPGEQLTLAQQITLLRRELAHNIAPLDDIADSLNQRLADIAQLQNSLRDVDLQSADSYTRNLALAEQKLSASSARLNKLLTPARTLLTRMDNSVNGTDKYLSAVWENYYLTPAKAHLKALDEVPDRLIFWNNSLDSRLLFAYPQSREEWLDSALYFGLTAMVMLFLGFLALRGTSWLPARWSSACGQIIRHSFVLSALGLSILGASFNPQGGIYAGLALVGSLILMAGIAALSWKLRVTLLPELKNQPSPLNRLYAPAAIGVLTIFADLPEPVPSLLWAVTSLTFSAVLLALTRYNKKNIRKNVLDKLPAVERFSLAWSIIYGLPSFLLVVAGYAYLAILIFMLCYALTNILILGNALMGLLNVLVGHLFDQKKHPLRNAVAEAISTPVAWLFSLLATLPWLLVAPGARYLFQRAFTRHYTFGQADFDFYKVLLIALLFFLCRSFIKLGKTSLTHLSENIPQLERGVIPPLRAMFSYLLWVLFALLTLSLLGVDLTSLAVVAGGLSVGIGFGLQTLFNNLISGLILIFGHSLLVGDYVTVGTVSGTVRAINIRATILETFEQAAVYVPNSAIIAGQFTNWTRNSRITRRSFSIGVAYGSDTKTVLDLLKDIALQQDHVLKNPPPAAYFDNFGANSLDFVLNVFIDDFDFGTSTMSELRLAVEKTFREKGIDIPFPQMTVHLQGKQPSML
ncbi:MAG: mechanosensitive ion channel [Deltaproteobacteria bacterium]|jgi:small-conductance mechanosensitive channel|nr:mechanosensitive ion channel [Deltaproteobacteria bacterium]